MCIDCHWQPASQTPLQLQHPTVSPWAQPLQQAVHIIKNTKLLMLYPFLEYKKIFNQTTGIANEANDDE